MPVLSGLPIDRIIVLSGLPIDRIPVLDIPISVAVCTYLRGILHLQESFIGVCKNKAKNLEFCSNKFRLSEKI